MNEQTMGLEELTERETPGGGEVHSIGEVLAELLASYEARFPQAKVTLVRTPAAT
jgi:hypothetical protein